MRVCPTCGARYEAPAQFCQRDGVPLRIEQEARDPYLGTKILGQFRLEKVVGSGGMGIVYAGWDEGLGRRVAVKILHRDLVANRDVVARFHREAQIAHQLDHPNIVRLILFGQLSDGNLYLVLEYLEGPTLLQAIDRDGPMPPARAVKIASSVSDAIGYAHRRDIIHRDLKPENIMLVNRDGDADHPKVLDFGIAKMLIGGDTLVTQAGLIFGTARYISPEGAQGDPVDKRSDVYSLGVIAYQLLCGVTPFDSTEPVQLLLKHIHETPAALHRHAAARNVPPALEAVVMRSLAKSPAARYADGTAFAKALREALAESDPNAAIRSVVPTASMPMYLGNQSPMNGHAAIAPAQSPVHASAPGNVYEARHADASQSRPAAPNATMLAGSPSHAHVVPATSVHQGYAPVVQTSPAAGSSGPYPAIHGSSAIAMPAVPRPAPTVAVPAFTPALEPEYASHARPLPMQPHPPSASSALSSTPSIDPRDSDDDISIPGLPKSKLRRARKQKQREAERANSAEPTDSYTPPTDSGSSKKTLITVVASVIATLLIGATAAWALGLYPSQRRALEVSALLARSEDALRAERYLHEADENDVEDLTDAVLALDPNNTRAAQIRQAGAMRLRNRAVEMRNGGHPDQALPLLRNAMRLVDDSEIRTLMDTIEAETRAPVPTTPATAPTTAPATTPTAHPTTPRPHHTNEPEPPPTTTTQPVLPTPFRPTFTPGRDPNQPAPTTPPTTTPQTTPQPPVITHPTTPTTTPTQPDQGMHGGPSQVENPPPDPTGAVAF